MKLISAVFLLCGLYLTTKIAEAGPPTGLDRVLLAKAALAA